MVFLWVWFWVSGFLVLVVFLSPQACYLRLPWARGEEGGDGWDLQ